MVFLGFVASGRLLRSTSVLQALDAESPAEDALRVLLLAHLVLTGPVRRST
jgi:hypothetical protein